MIERPKRPGLSTVLKYSGTLILGATSKVKKDDRCVGRARRVRALTRMPYNTTHCVVGSYTCDLRDRFQVSQNRARTREL